MSKTPHPRPLSNKLERGEIQKKDMINVFDILSKVYGARGIPFPNKPLEGSGSAISNGFEYKENTTELITDGLGSYIKEYTDESLGQYVFMPVSIDGYKLSHPLIIISGEKQIIETDLVEVGTVFEKVFTRPYDITIITTIRSEERRVGKECA